MLKFIRIIICSILVLAFCLPVRRALAQETRPDGPVYIVQSGDSLWSISQRFGVSLNELARANGITDAGQLTVDSQLIIPGLEGIQGTLTTESLPYGETLRSLSRRYQIPIDLLARLNHVTSPYELFAGADLIITEPVDGYAPGERLSLLPGQSLLELSILHNTNPWTLKMANNLSGAWAALPLDVLRLPGQVDDGPGALHSFITDVQISPLPFTQGKTAVVTVASSADLSLSGSFLEYQLHFFPDGGGKYVALQGIHAFTEPGFYPLTIMGTLPDGAVFEFSQPVYVRDGAYLYDPPLQVDEETVDPAITAPEDEQWFSFAESVTPQRAWNGIFTNPSPWPLEIGFPSVFGSRRSYNGSTYDRFHSGLDMYGDTTTDIYAAAPGKIVFTGELTVRGNAVMIDHGWGVYTAYVHMSRIDVQEGDSVDAGHLLGKIGATGRVSGPHLHFEVIVNGIQVDPFDWLTQAYP